MGSQERRNREREAVRQLILDAAMKLWIEKGFESVTIRHIADLVEYTPGAIYSYFKDKEEIFYTLHLKVFEDFYEVLQNAALFGSPIERLQKIGEAYLSFAFENPERYDLMFISAASGKKISESKGWHVGEKSFELLHATVKLAMDEGYIPTGDPKAASMMLWTNVHGIASLLLRDRYIGTFEETKTAMHDGMTYMIRSLAEKSTSNHNRS
ncbi:MAG: TetR/AcrR family transcriptional regulator [Chloroherpetonaceae bacterium]|nr:TetR/AcrR family transcriptional regulator [Chloroherpetonaceae bacterium]